MSGTSTIKICCCYSHEDKKDLVELEKHLTPLKSQGLISIWSDKKIKVGEDWAQAIEEQLKTAHIILLLISSDFISSDYCSNKEMARAMERYEKEQTYVIPINLRQISPPIWNSLPFGKLQAIPNKVIPYTPGEARDAAFSEVAGHIFGVVSTLRAKIQTIAEEAERYFGVGKYPEALNKYQELINLDVQHQDAYIKKVQTLLKLDRPEECLACLQKAPKPDTLATNISLYECYARVYEILEKNEESLTAYDKAINTCDEALHKLDGERKNNHNQKSDDNSQKDDFIEHKAHLLECKAHLLYSMHRENDALSTYEKLANLYPQEATYEKIGEIQYQLHQYNSALKTYQNAIGFVEKETPHNLSTIGHYYHKMGEICVQQAHFQQALEFFEKAIEYDGQEIYLLEKGKCLLQLAHYNEAYEIFEQCISLRKQVDEDVRQKEIDLHIYYGHSQALFHLQQLDLSLSSLNTAIDITSPHTPFELYDTKRSIYIDLSAIAERQAEEAKKNGYSLEKRASPIQDSHQPGDSHEDLFQSETTHVLEKLSPDVEQTGLTPEESFYIPILQILNKKKNLNKVKKAHTLREGLSTSEIQLELIHIMHLSTLDLMPADRHNPHFQNIWELTVRKAYYNMAAKNWIEQERETNTWKISEKGHMYLISESGTSPSIQNGQQGEQMVDALKNGNQPLPNTKNSISATLFGRKRPPSRNS